MIIQNFISKIALENFRSYLNLSLDFNNSIVVFYGDNGAGKTNILEALSLFDTGKGIRSAKLEEILNNEKLELSKRSFMPINQLNCWSVFLNLNKNCSMPQTFNLGVGYKETEGNKKIIRLDGKDIKQNELSDLISLIWLTPAQDKIFREGASQRRKFFDKLIGIIDNQHKSRIYKYEYYLKEWQTLFLEGRADERWFKGLEENLSQTAVTLAASRLEGIKKLSRVLNSRTGAFPAASLVIKGEIEERLKLNSALNVEDELKIHYQNLRKNKNYDDFKIIGPHNTDINAVLKEKNISSAICSTGEQKALLISIILSHAKLCEELKGFSPILLLDEVVAHLDNNKKSAFFEEITELKFQTFMTGVSKEDFYPLKNKSDVFNVVNSKLFRV